MPSRFNVIFPSTGRIGLDGGLNTKIDRQLLLDNESPDCQNVIFGNGSVETRGGSDLLNTAPVGSFVADGIYTRHDSNGSETMVAWWDGTLFDLQGTSFISVTSAKCIFTASVRVYSTEYENYIYFSNGYTSPYKWNGAEFTRMSIPAPGSGPVAATAPSGANLTGGYSYKVTYVNSNLVESDVSTVGNTITASTEDIRLTSIAVAPASFGVGSRRIYRTEADGTTYKRLVTLSDNTTTTYDDGVVDGSLGVTAPTDQGEISVNATALLYHQGRIFYIDSADFLVKYSEIGNPYVFKATSFIRIGDSSGDIPKTLGIHDNSIAVGCVRSSWVVYMPDTTASNWIQLRLKTALGSRSPFSILNYSNKLMFAAMENDKFMGFAAISGQTVEPTATLMTISATGSDQKSNVIEPDIESISETYVPNISSMIFKNKAYIAVTYSTGSINNRIYVFDYSLENMSKKQLFSWTRWTGLNAAQFTIYDDKIYYADSSDVGSVYEMNTDTYNDNGAAIDSYYWTKEFPGKPGHENMTKDFRWLHILFELSGDYFMNITRRINSLGGVGDSQQIDLDPGSTLWGTLVFGRDVWSPGGEQDEIKHSLGSLLPAKRIQFKFDNQNTINQKFKIIGLNLDYNIRARR